MKKQKLNFGTCGKLIACSLLLTSLVSCGNDDDNDNDTPVAQQQEQEQDDGIYRANLATLNPGVAGNAAAGTAFFEIRNGKIMAMVDMTGTPANVTHIQHIHGGSACPTPAADTNGDTFVDVVEGVPAYGPILVNLDGNLKTFAASSTSFPKSDNAGTYSYHETASFDSFIKDLRMPDTDTTDAIAKLGATENINMSTRHVVVHGVPSSANLPASVQSLGTIPADVTLPIACGQLTRVSAEEEAAVRTQMTTMMSSRSSSMGSASHGH